MEENPLQSKKKDNDDFTISITDPHDDGPGDRLHGTEEFLTLLEKSFSSRERLLTPKERQERSRLKYKEAEERTIKRGAKVMCGSILIACITCFDTTSCCTVITLANAVGFPCLSYWIGCGVLSSSLFLNDARARQDLKKILFFPLAQTQEKSSMQNNMLSLEEGTGPSSSVTPTIPIAMTMKR